MFTTPKQNKNVHPRLTKSAGNGRRCFVDKSLPTLSSSFSVPSPSPAKQCNNSLNTTPDIRSIVHEVSKSTGAKRKLGDYSVTNLPKRKKLSFTTIDVVPMYNDYQLLGDSQFVRFSEKMLSLNVTYLGKKRFIGYCVSGQKIEDLRRQIRENVTTIHSNVIVLIGTNDIVYKSDYALMCNSYERMLKMLKKKCSKIVLLTVPPVPKFEACQRHWTILKKFNKFIHQQADEKITVLDLCSLFISYDNTISKDYYEEVYNTGPRLDLIHLNLKGFKALKFLLDLHISD